MVALSIDTAANVCAACISDINSGKILASFSHDIGRGHAELLMDTIEQCMKKANTGYGQVELIISSIGPGSFTGVRVGLSAARAIGLGLSKPVVGVSNLLACAHYALQIGSRMEGKKRRVSVILDARRNEVYFQRFENNVPIRQAGVCRLEELVNNHRHMDRSDEIFCGSAAMDFQNALADSGLDSEFSIAHRLETAPIEIIAALGMAGHADEKCLQPPEPLKPPEPLYLRGADAKQQQGFAVPLDGIRDPAGGS
jgi:tRNA threonylcarbamoyladenosine biosynthesis protein TsaB